MKIKNSNIWWGPPKKFSTEFEERKISWLELFYDLAYVIAISKITHHLSDHLSFSGLLDYTYFFIMIFWGWLNGSLYHDLHGTSGLRTSLMTLWQIMIVAALVVILNSPPESLLFNATIAVMIMQLFITYLWWSVGIYDKAHRKLNKPYTVIFLISFALMFLTLFLEQPYVRIVFYLTLLLNYLPPFLLSRKISQTSLDFSLSASMTERLGLFTIIIFGESVLGVINGISDLGKLNRSIWMNFGVAILIVFSLWWIFFTLISDRPCKKGFLKSSLMEILYIPTLMSLGCIGVAFNGLFSSFEHTEDHHSYWIKITFGAALCTFLLGISLLLNFLDYPTDYIQSKRKIQRILSIAGVLFFLLTIIELPISIFIYLLVILLILLGVILIISKSWIITEINNLNKEG